jgi:hypothetical protein
MLMQKGAVNVALFDVNNAIEKAIDTVSIHLSRQTHCWLTTFLPGQAAGCGFGDIQDLP